MPGEAGPMPALEESMAVIIAGRPVVDRPAGAWHVQAVRLPDGEAAEDWWIVDGCLTDRPVPEAVTLPGDWFLPGGLVDAHVHRTMNFNGFALPDGSDALVAAHLAAQRAAGVLAVRDAGLAWGGWPSGEPAAGPHVQSAGNLLAAPGRGYPGLCRWVKADQLVAVALEEVARGAAWVKLLADFPDADGNWFAAPPSYPVDALRRLVTAVHGAGARVMAHSTGLAAEGLVEAGVDSIEHGMQLSDALLERMARRGIAWCLTLGTALKHVGPMAGQANPVGQYLRDELARVRRQLALAARLGVPLLVGTDEMPTGTVAQEVVYLCDYGLTATQALATASTAARAWLGWPAFAAGAPAELVTFTRDPRREPAILTKPSAIVFGR
jgi:imidazolonepropionase-like amidohydrolase